MVIYVAEDLIEVRCELEKRGYNIARDSYSTGCDAIICNLKYCSLNSSFFQGTLKREGTLIIDMGSKTIEEIEYILNNRVYSSLF